MPSVFCCEHSHERRCNSHERQYKAVSVAVIDIKHHCCRYFLRTMYHDSMEALADLF